MLEWIRELLLDNELLLLFVVISIGCFIGNIKYKKFHLGIVGVLFVGLFVGAWKPLGTEALHISHGIREIGLILFVYIVGISNGYGFFASLKSKGLKYTLVVILTLTIGGVITILVGRTLGISPAEIAGVFCGGLTNTPALGALTEFIGMVKPNDVSIPTIGYSIAYPISILASMLILTLFHKTFYQEYQKENVDSDASTELHQLIIQNFVIENDEITSKALCDLRIREKIGVVVCRLKHDNKVTVPNKNSVFNKGDIIVAVGEKNAIEKAEKYFGSKSDEHIDFNCETIDYRIFLVSNRNIAGKTLAELNLPVRFNAQVVRVKRVDIEFVPDGNTVIEMGDRLRVVMPVDRIKEVGKFVGDSVKGFAELDYPAIALGISIGVLIGMIKVPFAGGGHFTLGIAGGTLLVGLILGRIGRTGPFVWSIPIEARQALSNFGLLIFLAAVGVSSGSNFFEAISTNGGKLIILASCTAFVTLGLSVLLFRYICKAKVADCMGILSGIQTQPASLSNAYKITQSNDVYIGYAMVYPTAMIVKIVFAQLVYILSSLM